MRTQVAVSKLLLDDGDDASMFALAPVSLWLEDYSGVRVQFEAWREAGVTSLRAFLLEDLARVKHCAQLIRVIKVNARTLALFEAADVFQLAGQLDRVFRDDMLVTHLDELVQLWEGKSEFASHTVNYTLSDRRLDVQLSGAILPGYEADWSRVLVAIEDVTERESARRRLAESELYARGLFSHSPVSLWVEDFSAIKRLLDEVSACGIADLRTFTDVHPDFVDRCMREIRIVDVNQQTLKLFGAADKETLIHRTQDIFRAEMRGHFREQLIDLWGGKLFQQREVVNYALNGDALHLHMQFSILPGCEHDWSLAQIALTDITARKKAEAYLEFLGKHDVLTKLYNRSFFVDEINRLERGSPRPTTVIVADLNGLKLVNDSLGHAAGDDLLRRAGEILNELVEKPACAARIGGDEFAILLPATTETAALALIERLEKLIALNNQFYSHLPLSFSLGLAAARDGERLEDAVRRADAEMYAAKRRHYAESEARAAAGRVRDAARL